MKSNRNYTKATGVPILKSCLKQMSYGVKIDRTLEETRLNRS